MPSEPPRAAASSLKISPNMFSQSITSNCVGFSISCIAALSTNMCSSVTPGYCLPFRGEGTGVSEFLPENHRPEVREEAEFLADAEQRRALGPFLPRNGRVALRQTDRAEKNGVGVFAKRKRGIGQRLAGGVNARP